MKTLDELFTLHRAKSDLFVEYEPGRVPYVGNGMADNGVTGFVTPNPGDKVFKFTALVISAFCEATVQTPPFVACGRAGNGLVVLEPKSAMDMRQLIYIAAYVNIAVKWRFNWYRQTTVDRLRRVRVPHTVPASITCDLGSALKETLSRIESGANR